MSELEAMAKAVEKTADLGTQALQTGEKAGGFIARVFQEPIETTVGMLTDRLRVMRLRNWDKMADEVEEILVRRGVCETRAVPPKLGIPVLESAAVESDPELHALWSRLLANAMDPQFGGELRVAYAEIIKSMNPSDAKILFAIYNSLSDADRADPAQAKMRPFNEAKIRDGLSISARDYAVSIDNLLRLQCIVPHARRAALGNGLKSDMGEIFLSIQSREPAISITALGINFVNACTDRGCIEGSVQFRAEDTAVHRVESTFEFVAANL